MKILVLGMGYVGLTASACALKGGHEVTGVDTNQSKIELLKEGGCPIYETGVGELLLEGIQAGKFSAELVLPSNIRSFDLIVVCVGTPSAPDGKHDMSHIAKVTKEIGLATKHDVSKNMPTLCYRSTFRPGTMNELVIPILKSLGVTPKEDIRLVYNPEFLRESTAIKDYFSPPKIVLGTDDGMPDVAMQALYEEIDSPMFCVKYNEAEMTKFVDNTFHALKVAFGNEVGRLCRSLNLDIDQVHEMFIADTKLNISSAYLKPGGAFGGSCLPKDVRAFVSLSREFSLNNTLTGSLIESNNSHISYIYEQATKNIACGASIIFDGITFKSNTDDLRESPTLELVRMAISAGYQVRIRDKLVSQATLDGANLSYVYSIVPSLNDLLLQDGESIKGTYNLMITNNYVADADIRCESVYEINSLDFVKP